MAITASFAINTYTITATGDSRGTIAPSGNVSVTHGTGQTFTITPGAGYDVVNVFVDGVPQGPVASYTFPSVTGEGHTIRAIFIPDGDMNGDGNTDVADALRAMQIAVGGIEPSAADMLHGDVAPLDSAGTPVPDRQITVVDALLILKKVVGLTSGW